MKFTIRLIAIPLAVGALAFAGCGSSDNSDNGNTGPTIAQPPPSNATGGNGTTGNNGSAANGGKENASGTIDVAADPSGALAYDPDMLNGKAGKVEIDFTNDSPLPHDIVIDSPDGKEVAKTSVFNGGSEKASFNAKPGSYTFYCSVPGHREGGMEGTLEIK